MGAEEGLGLVCARALGKATYQELSAAHKALFEDPGHEWTDQALLEDQRLMNEALAGVSTTWGDQVSRPDFR